ncbi:hypothetical protein P6U16_03105 [Rhizobium sp. 32-5/1]|uniref:hypothetical protein n=1 Tax=Rhizobium sp. 32-5/1 TaxID=3019602 RepID=UPI00240D4519|nr:hypothetical protein [Rhizobium sp. 32-5/1]WEZ83789.1 hypothetical protein P6U16_03105 [Rhizobium sp. 32-5/1]
MAEVTNELIYEVLKAMQSRLSNIEHKLGEMDNRLTSMSAQINAVHIDISNIYQSIGYMDRRLTRIEKRLDIIEEPAE